MRELRVEAAIEKLDEVAAFVEEWLAQYECPVKIVTQLEIAVEEIFVNIASYAYCPKSGDATVQIRAEENPLTVVITFLDNGVPYNPLTKAEPDTTLSAEEREIGGLGIFMVKKSMDEVAYEYKDGQNRLTIKKALQRRR